MCGNVSSQLEFPNEVRNPLYVPPNCPICFEEMWFDAFWCPRCKHAFHRKCLKRWGKGCPLCRYRF